MTRVFPRHEHMESGYERHQVPERLVVKYGYESACHQECHQRCRHRLRKQPIIDHIATNIANTHYMSELGDDMIKYQEVQAGTGEPKFWKQSEVERMRRAPASQPDAVGIEVRPADLVAWHIPWVVVRADTENGMVQEHIPT